MKSDKKPVISAEGLSVRYGRTAALRDVSLKIYEGEFLGIIGPNGGGKSTLLKAVLGLLRPESGKIEVFGAPPGKAGGISYVPQTASMDKSFPITVREVVLTGCAKAGIRPFFKFSAEDKKLADELLEKTGLSALASKSTAELSGGEFQKTLIARALAARPKLLLLDEPTANVDAASGGRIYELLDELNKSMTILLVTHDLFAVSSRVKSLACLNRTLVYHGEPELTEGVVKNLYGCPVDLIAHGLPHRVLKEHGEGCPSC